MYVRRLILDTENGVPLHGGYLLSLTVLWRVSSLSLFFFNGFSFLSFFAVVPFLLFFVVVLGFSLSLFLWWKQNINPMCKVLMKQVDSGEQHHSLTSFTWDALKENSKQAKTLWTIRGQCSNVEKFQARTN